MAWNVWSGWPRIRYRLVGPKDAARACATQNDRENAWPRIEAEEHGKKEARFELRQRREVTLTSISVRLRGARRCLRYIRKRLASVRNKSNTGSSKRLSRYVSYRASLHLRKCTDQTNDANGQCAVVIPSRRLQSNRNDRFYRLSVNPLKRTFSSFLLSLSLRYLALVGGCLFDHIRYDRSPNPNGNFLS